MSVHIDSYAAIADMLERAGIAVPDGIARNVAIVAAARAYGREDPAVRIRAQAPDLTVDTVADAIRQAAIDAAAHNGAATMASQVEKALAPAAREAWHAALPDVTAAAAANFNRTADELTDALDGFTTDDNELTVLRRGGSDLWDEAQAAAALAADLHPQWDVLLQAARNGHPTDATPQAILVIDNPESRAALDRAQELIESPTAAVGDVWHELIAAGFTVKAQTPSEVAATLRRLDRADALTATNDTKLTDVSAA